MGGPTSGRRNPPKSAGAIALYEVLHKYGANLEQAAEALGYDRRATWAAVTGMHKMPLELAVKIWRLYGISPDLWLLPPGHDGSTEDILDQIGRELQLENLDEEYESD